MRAVDKHMSKGTMYARRKTRSRCRDGVHHRARFGRRLQDLGAGHVVLASDADAAWADRAAWSGAALAVIEVHETRPALAALAAKIAALGVPVIQITTDAGVLSRRETALGPVLLIARCSGCPRGRRFHGPGARRQLEGS